MASPLAAFGRDSQAGTVSDLARLGDDADLIHQNTIFSKCGGCYNFSCRREYFVMAAAKMTIVGDRRFVPDRRTINTTWTNNRRVRPDRRLNSIIAEWVTKNEVLLQPSLFKAYMKTKTRK